MADIFDQLSGSGGGDIFDQLAPQGSQNIATAPSSSDNPAAVPALPSWFNPRSGAQMDMTEARDVASDPYVQNLGQAAGDIAKGIPQMALQIPKYGYEGAKVASGNESPAEAAMKLWAEAQPQGRAMAQGLQSPVGSRQWDAAAIQALLMATPGLEIAKELRGVKPEVPPPEPPPIQPEDVPPVQPQAPASVFPQSPEDFARIKEQLQAKAVEKLGQGETFYHGSRTGELGNIQEMAPSFNFFGRDGIYLTKNVQHARAYANGLEARPGEEIGNGKVAQVEVSPTNTIDALAPLGENAAPLAQHIQDMASGLSKVGQSVVADSLSKVTPKTRLLDLATEGISTASFIGRALRRMGFDAIRNDNEFVLLDPSKAKISNPNIDLQPDQPQVTIPKTEAPRRKIGEETFKSKSEAEARISDLLETVKASPKMMELVDKYDLTPEELYTTLKSGNKWTIAATDAHLAAAAQENAVLRPNPQSSTIPAEDAKYAGIANESTTGPDQGGIQASESQTGQSDAAPEQPAGVGSPEVDSLSEEERRYSGVSTKNEYTQGRREVMGMEPAEEAGVHSDQSVQNEADAIIRRTPDAGRNLAAELSEKPRPISDVENEVLRRHISDLERQHAELVDHINKTQDASATEQLNTVRDNLLEVYDAAQKTGTELGRGLRQRQVEGSDQYTLPKMEAERRAVNGGKPLNPEQLKQVQELHNRISSLESKLAAREKAISEGRVSVRPSRSRVVEFLDKQADAARARLIAKRGRLNIGFDPTTLADEIIIGASHIARGIRNFDVWSGKMLQEFGDRVKPYLRDLYENARRTYKDAARAKNPPKSFKPTGATAEAVKEFQRQDRYRTATIKKTEELKAKTEAKDVSQSPQRADFILDPLSQKLRAEYQKAKYDYQVMLEKDRLAKRPMLKKVVDTAVDLERAMKLTGIKTFGKLGSAGIARVGQTAAEGTVAKAMSLVPGLRRVMQAAPTEGAPTIRSTAAYIRGFGQGVRDIPGVVKGDILTRDIKEGSIPRVKTWTDLPGRLHGAVKQPFKMAAEKGSLQKALDTAIRQGQDINKPGVIEGAQARAQEAGLRAIFTNDNLLSNAWNNMMQGLEHNKKFPTAGYAASRVGQFLLPIVRVPTNIATEVGVMNTGGLTGSLKLLQVMKRGMETMKPEEADMIARHFKKGAVGAGLFLYGYFNADKFGGFYQERQGTKKRDLINRNGMQPNEARFGAMTVPSWLLMHSPAGLEMQLGATVRKYVDTGKSKPESAMTAAHEILTEVPFVKEMSVIDDLLKGNWEGNKARGNLLKSTIVPQGVQNVADWLDQGRKRSPKTMEDYIKSGIPGLREQVPLSKYQP